MFKEVEVLEKKGFSDIRVGGLSNYSKDAQKVLSADAAAKSADALKSAAAAAAVGQRMSFCCWKLCLI